jgi:hypothetical protein
MDLAESIKLLASRIEKQRDSVLTEQACKAAFVMPFLNALGYDVFDPDIVVPEFTADVGVKKGEKVDYAIKVGGQIAILIECKGFAVNLAQVHMSQLFRYFTVTDARFGVLTNGIEYHFYSDLDAPNKMDQRPFFCFNVLAHRPDDLTQLQKFSAEAFNVEAIVSTASTLKYGSAIKAELQREMNAPSEEMVRLLVGRVFEGRFTQKVKEDFTPLVQAAFQDAVRERVADRLTSALEATTAPDLPAPAAATPDSEILTTQDELEAFHIVKAIVRNVIRADRVVMRDAKSYCAILIDDNNRKPLIRLHFNAKTVWYISLFKAGQEEEKIRIDSLDDIYAHETRLRETAVSYDQAKTLAPA